MTVESNKNADMSLWIASIPVVFLMGLLGAAVILFGDSSSSGPNQISLMLAAGVGIIVGLAQGMSWNELEQALIDGIMLAMKACLILLMVGSLIGSWMLAGTAPAIIHLGLGVLGPDWFYPASMIVCALVAISIGSSWTTAATVGLALVGIAGILGLSAPITAGAVISGAYFGDKMSPLSDTTNLAPAMAGAELFTHIRHMFWTTGPSFLLALVLFSSISLSQDVPSAEPGSIEATRLLLEQSFSIGIWSFFPLALLLFLAFKKVPALPTITIGAIAGCVIAAIFQPDLARQLGTASGAAVSDNLQLFRGLWSVVVDGFQSNTGDASLDSLLSRGGMSSMLNTVWLIISAMCFGGIMEHTGILQRIATAALTRVRGTGSLIVTTVLTAIGMNVLAADQYIAIVLPGRMYRAEFKRRGLAPENLSRTVEDAGTMTSALIPWNTCGAFMAATLGVPTFAYAPFAFLNIFNPIIAVIYGVANIRITKLDEIQTSAAQA